MKYMIISFLLATAFFSCKDNGRADVAIGDAQVERFGKDVASEPGYNFGTYAVKDVNASHYRFAEAIEAFEKKEYDRCAGSLRLATAALMTEGQGLKGEAADRLQTSTANLEALAREVQEGSVKDITRLQKAIAVAQLSVAHQFAVGLQQYSVFVPMPDAYYPHYKATIQAVREAEANLSGAAKTEAQALITDADSLLERMNAGETIAEADIKKERDRLDAFLAQYGQ